MKKDQSSHLTPDHQDFSLPRAKILRGRKNFQRLFQRDAETFRKKTVELRFRIYPDLNDGCLMGFVVGKKHGKATKRNQIKRLLREAYRLNQHILTPLFEHTSTSFHGVFVARTIETDFETVQGDVIDLLQHAKEHVLPIIEAGS